ncbi:hypothetical protein GALMADRAFT_254554 [Galerina marginata CBS 339.88]|uniref:Uncharacterized protein n=1 Tax=Galerina marginata (strain CBS 339.88) TaxID=685588 RepID=A0A067SJA6_GALM3|nr:hypothetical protein GALMADRAFT_254554 [Galerina marginata CBS 339.88]
MRFDALLTFLATSAIPLVFAQSDAPIYVPFEWDQKPITASVIGSSGQTTSYALVDGPTRGVVPPGPATLVQGPSAATMFYVNSGAATPTLSGVCNLVSPVAVCTLNVYETGAPLPASGPSGSSSTTSKKSGSTGKSGSGSGGSTPGSSSGSSGAARSSTGAVMSMTTLAIGFCIALAFVR